MLGILLSVLVLSAISSLIVGAIVVVNPEITASFTGQRQPIAREAIGLEEAMLGELTADHFYSHWLDNNGAQNSARNQDELLYEDSKNILLLGLPVRPQWIKEEKDNETTSTVHVKLDLESQKTLRQLVSNSSLLVGALDYQGFKLSPSKRYLLIWTSRKRQFRHTSTARYYIYDIQQDLITQLSTRPEETPSGNSYQSIDSIAQRATPSGPNKRRKQQSSSKLTGSPDDIDPTQFQLANWFSLNGSDALILVQANDIYLLGKLNQPTGEGGSGEEPASSKKQDEEPGVQLQRITWDGRPGELFNAVPDWLYEEEILADRQAYDFSQSTLR